MRLSRNILMVGLVTGFLVGSGCRTSSGSKLKSGDLGTTESARQVKGLWFAEADQTVHVGICPASEAAGKKSCKGLREDHAPLNMSEYELRLRQSIVNFRIPGTPVVMEDPTVLDMRPKIQLGALEEARVSEIIRVIRESPMGLFDSSDPNYRLALAPFVPMGGSLDAMWLTKSVLLPAKSTRENVGAITPSHTFKFDGLASERPVVLSDGTVVFANGASIFWLKNGVRRFEFKSREISGSTPAMLPDGTIVIGKGQRVYWLKNGVKKYEFLTEWSVHSSPAILSDGTVVIGSGDGKVYWLKDGEKQAEFQTGGAVRSSAAVLYDDTVVIGSDDHKVYWLRDGDKKFEFATGDAVASSPAVLFDGTIVIGSNDDRVYWLKDGVKRFDFKTNGDIRISPVLLSDGSVVVASENYMLYWLKDGVKNFEFQGQVRSAPAVLSDDTIVVGVGIGIYWVKNGIKRFEFQKDGEVYLSPVVLADGTIVVGADNGRRFDNGRLFWLE